MSLSLRYFAWVRERIGRSEETVEPPQDVTTIADLIAWLSRQEEGYAAAFSEPEVIRAAIDQEHVEHDAKVRGAREIAFFPAMSGG